MDKYLILLGLQLTQSAVFLAVDGSAWRALVREDLGQLASGLDLNALVMLFETLIGGTWVGKIAELGQTAVALVHGVEGVPLWIIGAQWLTLAGWFALERHVLQRRLRAIEQAAG